MGQAAAKRATVPRGAHLRVVRGRKTGSKSSRRAVASDVCLRGFQMCVLLMVCASLFGMGRVMLSTKAVEASFQSEILAQDIKAEQLEGDLLEVNKSSLATPSRIEQIAVETMSMSEAGDITYLCLPEGDSGAAQAADTPEATENSEGGVAALFSSVMEMTAGEAQVLLVGDLGLASSK